MKIDDRLIAMMNVHNPDGALYDSELEKFRERLKSIQEKAVQCEQAGDIDAAGDQWAQWAHVLENASCWKAQRWATVPQDLHRCENCPHLGKGVLYETGGQEVLCDCSCMEVQ